MSKRNRNNRPQAQRADAPAVLTADAFSNPLFRLGAGSQSPLEATQYPLTRMTDNYALLNSLYRDVVKMATLPVNRPGNTSRPKLTWWWRAATPT